MTKKELTAKVKEIWKELNDNGELSRKIELLNQLEIIVNREIVLNGDKESLKRGCFMAILESREGLKKDSNFIDEQLPSNLLYFLFAINESELKDE